MIMLISTLAAILVVSTTYLARAFNPSLPSTAENSNVITKNLTEEFEGTLDAHEPNPIIWRPNARTEIVFRHDPTTVAPDYRKITPINWQHAVEEAQRTLQLTQARYHAGNRDIVPGNRFVYEEPLRHQGSRLKGRKCIRFEVQKSPYGSLEYGYVYVVLLGLLEYMDVWDNGSKNDRVHVCNFTYYWTQRYTYEVASGRAILLDFDPSD
ncbi:MAG: hypothetical protein Q9224_007247 [Gallowayella concinna]